LAAFPLEVWFLRFKAEPHENDLHTKRQSAILHVGWRHSENHSSDDQEVTRTDTSPLSHPQPHFAGRLGSALQALDRSPASWASPKQSIRKLAKPPLGELQLKAMSRRCLTEVGEEERRYRKLREKRYWVKNQ
jgi:hypothetical protein